MIIVHGKVTRYLIRFDTETASPSCVTTNPWGHHPLSYNNLEMYTLSHMYMYTPLLTYIYNVQCSYPLALPIHTLPLLSLRHSTHPPPPPVTHTLYTYTDTSLSPYTYSPITYPLLYTHTCTSQLTLYMFIPTLFSATSIHIPTHPYPLTPTCVYSTHTLSVSIHVPHCTLPPNTYSVCYHAPPPPPPHIYLLSYYMYTPPPSSNRRVRLIHIHCSPACTVVRETFVSKFFAH